MKKNKTDYVCMYVMSDGKPRTFMNSLNGTDIVDAMSKAVAFINHSVEAHGSNDTITSFHIMVKPKKGRSPKSKM